MCEHIPAVTVSFFMLATFSATVHPDASPTLLFAFLFMFPMLLKACMFVSQRTGIKSRAWISKIWRKKKKKVARFELTCDSSVDG